MQIVEGAYQVILQNGLSGTATRDVTRHLDVGSGLLHHYFKTWAELRAEVVRTFIFKEISELEASMAEVPVERLTQHFVDWMISDPDDQFWGLWLDAIEEARRDDELAEIIRDGHMRWHAVIADLIKRCVDAEQGKCDAPVTAAWRISALIDGLMGILALQQTALSPSAVRQIVKQQIALELGKHPNLQ
ncbi:hypothetical protein RA29_05740 [Tateyamaria sp. ANG-S1]|nr:hypothetical protein RA29_05740 [Tateyamaria sp. ANG-S1]